MIFDAPPEKEETKAHLGRWFLCFGVVGLCVCFALMGGEPIEPRYLPFWPATALLNSNPDRGLAASFLPPPVQFLCALWLFGSNFLLYGIAGAIIGRIVFAARKLASRRSP